LKAFESVTITSNLKSQKLKTIKTKVEKRKKLCYKIESLKNLKKTI
jgi:hypothetical protein